MAKIRMRKTSVKKGIFNQFKLTESYTSLMLGAIVVLIIGILFVSFAKGNRNSQTSSTKDNQKAELQKSQNTSSTYTIKPGDDLWSISEDIYKDGYKWVEIAKINKLKDPEIIHSGNKLLIPKELAIPRTEQTTKTQSTIMQNNSITESTYKIKDGDNLWDISVRAYGDGFKWQEIAKINNLENPDLIYPDNVLKIPRS